MGFATLKARFRFLYESRDMKLALEHRNQGNLCAWLIAFFDCFVRQWAGNHAPQALNLRTVQALKPVDAGHSSTD